MNGRSWFLVVAMLAAASGVATAHDVRGEAIFIDVGERVVDLEVQVSVAQLALARGETEEAYAALPIGAREADAVANVLLRDPQGRAFDLEARGVHFQADPAGRLVVFQLRATPPDGASTRRFAIEDDLVLRSVPSANAYVFARRDLRGGMIDQAPTFVGLMHYQARSIAIDRGHDGVRAAVTGALRVGRRALHHRAWIVFALLVVAPLAVISRRRFRGVLAIVGGLCAGEAVGLALGALHLGALLGLAPILVVALARRHRLSAIAIAGGIAHGLAFASIVAAFAFDAPSLALAIGGTTLALAGVQLAALLLVAPTLLATRTLTETHA